MLLIGATLFVLWCFVAWGAARWLVVDEANANGTRAVEVVAVLAGSSAYKERASHAAEVWRAHPAATIVLTNDGGRSGWLSSEQRNPLFVERARWALEREGVPGDQIESLPQTVSSTYQEAVLLHDFALRRGVRSMNIVTSAYHTRRAGWILRRVFDGSGVGLEIDAAASDTNSATWWLHGRGWRDVAGEYAKFAYYVVRY